MKIKIKDLPMWVIHDTLNKKYGNVNALYLDTNLRTLYRVDILSYNNLLSLQKIPKYRQKIWPMNTLRGRNFRSVNTLHLNNKKKFIEAIFK